MNKIFKVIFTFKVPSNAGSLLDFRTKIGDIKYAVEKFNANFSFKQVKLVSVRQQEIELLFSINVENESVTVSAKDLSVFSKRLYHDRTWSIYSRESAKLFTASTFEEVADELLQSYQQIPVIPDELQKSLHPELSKDINDQISDVAAVKAFESLINIQDIGDEDTRNDRKKGIVEIKRVLLSLLS